MSVKRRLRFVSSFFLFFCFFVSFFFFVKSRSLREQAIGRTRYATWQIEMGVISHTKIFQIEWKSSVNAVKKSGESIFFAE